MSLNILVVDDSSVMRRMILKTLRLSGIELGEIHQASNGKEGLEVLEEHWLDLALVDINMPVMNGEEMIDEVRRRQELADLPIIVVSTESSETRTGLLRQKCAGFVHKPFTPESLRETILCTLGECDDLADDTFSSAGFLSDSEYDF